LHHIIIEEFGFSVDDDLSSILSNIHPMSCAANNNSKKKYTLSMKNSRLLEKISGNARIKEIQNKLRPLSHRISTFIDIPPFPQQL